MFQTTNQNGSRTSFPSIKLAKKTCMIPTELDPEMTEGQTQSRDANAPQSSHFMRLPRIAGKSAAMKLYKPCFPGERCPYKAIFNGIFPNLGLKNRHSLW